VSSLREVMSPKSLINQNRFAAFEFAAILAQTKLMSRSKCTL